MIKKRERKVKPVRQDKEALEKILLYAYGTKPISISNH